MERADDIIAELRALREEQRATRLMLARTMALLMCMAKPMTAEQAEVIERRLMATDRLGG
jgi:hypothetical protein